MAGPSVAVRILGDLSGWSNSVSGAATDGETAGSRIKGAFSSVLGTLNRSGVLGPFGQQLDMVAGSLEGITNKTATVGEKMLGIGSGMAGIGGALLLIGSKGTEAQSQLKVAIENTGGSYDTYSSQIDAAVKAEEHHGEKVTDTMGALQKLTQATHDPGEALKILGTASDLAAAKHIDLSSAATQVGKAWNGSTKALKEMGITAKVSGVEAINDLAAVVKGQGDAAADSFSGKMRDLKAVVEDNVTTFAEKYGPAIATAGIALSGLGAGLEIAKAAQTAFKDSTLLATIATDAQKVATGLATAAQAAFNLVMDANPIILVAAAIIAIGAAFYEAYQHIGPFHDAINALWGIVQSTFDTIKTIISTVFEWLKEHWPLVLGILTGPFGLLVEQIATHWQTIKDTVLIVIEWFREHWANIWAILSAPFAALAGAVTTAWDTVSTFIGTIPAKLSALFKDASTWLVDAGKDIIKGLVKGITDAVGTVGKAIGGVAGKVKNFFKNPLSIFSPSKVFEEYGRNLMQGFANGVNNAAGMATAAVGSVAAGVAGIAPGAGSPVLAAAGGPLLNMENVNISNGVDLDLVTQRITAALMAGRL